MEGWRKVGSPIEFAKKYSDEGADELLLVDVVASLYDRNSLHEIIKKIASEIFIPLTIGGGVRNIEDVKNILDCGADKITLNTAATHNPNLVKEISKVFGSQACVVAIETIFRDGKWWVMTDNGRNNTSREAIEWAKQVADLGAGEVVLTAIHKEGLGLGLDLDLITEVSKSLSIPVVAGGGIGTISHIKDLFTNSDANAVTLAQALHWDKLKLKEIRELLISNDYYVRPI